mmetsp:Transcript_4083/g.6115  ORF Transcript_4083/g.6115 Transcript_4083/m.6115 type:complete len:278 (+) Transcript_4083:1834-2667(+)
MSQYQSSQCSRCHRFNMFLDDIPLHIGQGSRIAFSVHHHCAIFENPLAGSLAVDSNRPIGVVQDCGGALLARIECKHLVLLLVVHLVLHLVMIEAPLLNHRHESALRLVAYALWLWKRLAVLVCVHEVCRAVHCHLFCNQDLHFTSHGGSVLKLLLSVHGVCEETFHHSHLVLRQGSRLIRADVGRIAHRFTSSQHANEALVLVHLLRRIRQGNDHRQWKAFRNGDHHDGHGHDEGIYNALRDILASMSCPNTDHQCSKSPEGCHHSNVSYRFSHIF